MECRSCERCMFYVARSNGLVGRCRRHAPTIQGWPVMYPESWCGDYKLDERKLDSISFQDLDVISDRDFSKEKKETGMPSPYDARPTGDIL